MKICSPQLGLSPNSILGGEVFDREILLGLAKRNVKIEIILPFGKDHDKNIINWHISYLPITHFPAIFANVLYIPYLFQVYKKTKFQILRLHQPQFFVLPSLLLKIIYPDVKIVATYHQFRESKFLKFSRYLNNLWDHIICDSTNNARKFSKNYGVPLSKITVVHNGVPNYLKPKKKDKRLLKKLNLENKTVLLYMGLFIERKNPLFLLDMLKKMSKNHSRLVLIFWGTGPLENDIKTKAEELKISNNIRIIGPIYGKDKNEIHNIADVFVHPSLDEGFALSPLESMACAKPIIITKGYSAKECVQNGVNGFICEANNINQWMEKLSILTRNEKLREKFGQESLKRIKQGFLWTIAADKHFKTFKNLTHENS